MNNIYDVVFIGAGPANITAGSYLHKNQCDNFLIIDSGKNVKYRDHKSEIDCVKGVGGVGLFSDGKFSWYPSGTKIWNLEKTRNNKSYNFLKKILSPFIKDIPNFPDVQEEFILENYWKEKSYKSDYLNLEQRKNLLLNLTNDYINKFLLETTVVKITKIYSSLYYIECLNNITKITSHIYAKNIVFGGGRFMPLFMKNMGINIPFVFKRIELGVRFAGSSSSQIFDITKNTDIKFVKNDFENETQYKTFCTCRNGEIVLTNYDEIKTWSGRSDCEETNQSNFGFNVIFKNEKYMYLLESAISTQPFNVKYNDIDNNVNTLNNYDDVLKKLKKEISTLHTDNNVSTEELQNFDLIGPTIEGVGYYPKIDENLKIPDENIWVVGDCSGIFRGIIASMLSGIYVADILLENIIKE